MLTHSRRAGALAVVSALALIAMGLSLVPGAFVSAQNGAVNSDNAVSGPILEGQTLWFVQLNSAPTAAVADTAKTQQLAALKSDKDTFRSSAAAAGLQYKERYAYDTLWNGLSVEIAPQDVVKLRKIPGVVAVFPVVPVEAPEPPLPMDKGDNAPELFTAITMTGANTVQANGITGNGVRVAVMDTGVDYNHPDLGGCFGPGCKVVGGWDFVGDAYNSSGTTPAELVPHPDPDPMDCAGHGTHVSGIIGANGSVKGVAPDVTLRMYRVFGCVGTTSSDVMLAAMEMILKDGNKVLNMSIGSAYQWPQYPTAVAADNLVRKGVVVVASAGNNGANGLYSTGAPAVGARVISVASVDNLKVHSPAFLLAANSSLYGYQPMSGDAPVPPTSGSAGIVDASLACNPGTLPPNLSGNVALVERGVCSFRVKAQNVQAAGAAGALIYNSVSAGTGFYLGSVGTSPAPALTIPVVSMARPDGLAIQSQLPTSLTWTTQMAEIVNPYSGGMTSSFSSYGMAPDLSLKPDISAPGGYIFSTLPLAQGGYGLMSGTSMASPHAAGAVALLLQARPKINVEEVRNVLQNEALPYVWSGNPGLGLLDNTHRQGAGLLDIAATIQQTSLVAGPGKFSLGETNGQPVTRRVEVENRGKQAVTLDISHVPALATGPNTFTPSFFIAPASVSFSTGNTITVPPRSYIEVFVTVTENPSLPNGSLFGGYIVFTPQGGGRELRVPYSGFKGDYQSIVVLKPGASSWGNPILRATPTFGPNEAVSIDWVNNPGGTNLAFLLIHRDHAVRTLALDVINTNTNKVYNAWSFDYLGRNSGATSFSLYVWDGTDYRGRAVPSGTYQLRVRVLKALGDKNNPADTETWLSPTNVTVLQ